MKVLDVILKEAATNNFYTVGDSHARGVGTALGLDDTYNLAVNGAAAHGRGQLSGGMIAKISKIPKGANVLISVGANDTADVVKQNVDSQGKTKLPPANKIVGDVMKVVDAVKAQSPNKIVFMLFPNGENKKTQYYAGDYQKEVRDAIRSTVGVKVIDYDGSPLQPDGIHYQSSVYKKAGTEARKEFGVTAPVGNVNARPETVPTKDVNVDVSNGNVTFDTKTNSVKTQSKPDLNNPAVAGMFKGNAPKDSEGKDIIDLSVGPGKNYYNPKGFPNASTDKDKPSGAPNTNSTANSNTPAVVPAPVPQSNADKKDNRQDNRQDNKQGKNQNTNVAPVALPSLSTKSVTSGKIGKVLDFIASVEAINGAYNSVARKGKNKTRLIKGLEDATIGTVYKFQTELKTKNDNWSDAVGRYQYIQSTLRAMVEKMGLNTITTRFSPETQDSIATFHMRSECNLDSWINNNVSDTKFLESLSRIWAGVPSPSKGGKSYFKYDNANTSLANALGILKTIREEK